MLFNSFEFLLFFPIVVCIYFLLPHKYRWLHLLAASCFFYASFIPKYLFILGFTIIIDYIAGLYIEKAEGHKRKLFLTISIISNVGILAVFKYYNFFIDNLSAVFHDLPFLKWALPLGLSFHTFQAMSYTIEVFRGNQPAERHFGIYALYVMFFPQLVAGPIERPQNMLHQFHERKYFTYENVTGGLKLMAWGFFKKVVIADRLAVFVDPVYDHPHQQTPLALLIASFFFAIQIYCDFSGYSDIAIGSARVMGFKLMTNFDRPFISRNVSEYWRRWHISLSTWFNDYLFTPLAMRNRNWGKFSVVFALLITFLISGFWHGAGWTFIVWGLLHAVATIYEFLTLKWRRKVFARLPAKLSYVAARSCTFLYLIFAWIFFRARTISDAGYILKKLPASLGQIRQSIAERQLDIGPLPPSIPDPGTLFIPSCILLMLVFWGLEYLKYNSSMTTILYQRPIYIRMAVYCLFVGSIIVLGTFGTRSFIYFQF
jgi:alginate O-acetyltransferase complex protein AlgI